MIKSRGFTLIETIIAMALIMIAAFVFAPVFAMSFRQISDAGIWQNTVIRQRADLENQLARRGDILSSADTVKYPQQDILISLHEAAGEPALSETSEISGRILSDTLENKTNIKSFISDIYANESDTAGAKIIVAPKTIYYNEVLPGKIFRLFGVNLTFADDPVSKIKIYSGFIDVTFAFDIAFESYANMISLTVKAGAPAYFYRYAPFKIVYNGNDEAWITALSPTIIAVTDTGDFITGYSKDGSMVFAKGFGKITAGPVNDIVYNFQKREYVAAGNANLFAVFGNTLSWVTSNTVNLPSANNNYALSVDWLNNYMIGSSYSTAAESKVLLSVKNNDYAVKSVYEAQTTEENIYKIEAEWFDFMRSTAYVNTYDVNSEFVAEQSFSDDYIFAAGYYGVTVNDGNTVYYDLVYAIENDGEWFDISDPDGVPSNASASAVKLTGIASGVGKCEMNTSGTFSGSVEYSVFLACTDTGQIYGITPLSPTGPMIVPENTDWESVPHGRNIASLKSIAYGNGRFIAVGSGVNNIITGTVITNTASETPALNISMNWTEMNLNGILFEEIRFINYSFYAVGRKGDKGVIYGSQDGASWKELYMTADNCSITSVAGE